MVTARNELGLPPEVQVSGWKPSKKKGWLGLARGSVIAYRQTASRELSVGYVLYKDKANESVEIQTCRTIWTGFIVRHLQEYRTSNEEGAQIVTEPTDEVAKSVVFYRALVRAIALYQDGRMMQGDASAHARVDGPLR